MTPTEYQGTLAKITACKHIGKRANETLYIEIAIKHQVRSSAAYAAALQPFYPVRDAALTSCFARLRAVDWHTWLTNFRDVASLSFGSDDTNVVLACDRSNLQYVSPQIGRMSQKGFLGAAVFQ